MRGKPAGDVLAANLRALMASRPDRDSQPKVSAATRGAADQTTVGRVLRRSNSTRLETLDGLAAAFGLPAWALLVEGLDPKRPPQIPTQEELEAKINREVIARLEVILPEAKALLLDDAAPAGPSVGDPFADRKDQATERAGASPKGRKRR